MSCTTKREIRVHSYQFWYNLCEELIIIFLLDIDGDSGSKNGNLGKESAGFVSFRAFGQALTEWVWADYVIYFVLISAVLLCYFKKYFLSCGIEPLHEQSLSRRSLILSTNLPARRLSVCLQTRFYWTLLRNGWVIKLSCIFHVSFFNVLISPLSTQTSHRPIS